MLRYARLPDIGADSRQSISNKVADLHWDGLDRHWNVSHFVTVRIVNRTEREEWAAFTKQKHKRRVASTQTVRHLRLPPKQPTHQLYPQKRDTSNGR